LTGAALGGPVSIGVNLRKKPEFSKKRKEGCRERKKLK